MGSRNSTIDTAKGLGILLVVVGHNWFVRHTQGELLRVIFSFHVPLFFFLSGIFLSPDHKLGKFALSKADSLLKPYFFVLAAVGASKYLYSKLEASGEFDSADYLLGVGWGTGPTLDWMPMWFIPHLFLTLVCALATIKAIARLRYSDALLSAVMCAMLAMGIFVLGRFWQPIALTPASLKDGLNAGFLPGLPWSIDLLPVTVPFVLLGYLLRKQLRSLELSWTGLAVALACFASLHVGFNETIDLNLRAYGSPLIASAQAILGIYIACSLAALLQNFSAANRAIPYLGSASLFILIFHGFFQDTVFHILVKASGGHENLAALLGFIAAITGSILVWEAVKRQKHLAWILLPLRPASTSKGPPSPTRRLKPGISQSEV